MKCVVLRTCWPDADTVWKAGQTVEVTAAQYKLLGEFLKKVTPPKVEKVVEDGSKK